MDLSDVDAFVLFFEILDLFLLTLRLRRQLIMLPREPFQIRLVLLRLLLLLIQPLIEVFEIVFLCCYLLGFLFDLFLKIFDCF